MHADVFARLVQSVVRVNGMPQQRRAFVPTPVINQPPEKLRSYIEGDDPVSGRPFAQGVVEALTRQVSEEDLRGVEIDRSSPRLLPPDTEENLHRLFRENQWTDYLPIVLPTEERVEAMLAGTSHAADEIVGRLRPTHAREAWEFTVEKVAVNAVMAGANPAYLPIILAVAASGTTARYSSTSSAAAMVVVNGPIRHETNMNSGIGALGPYNHANATIGRAYGLLSQNLQGGSVPGETYMGSQGNNLAYNSITFAENEEASPWEPYHVQHGFDPQDSTVTVFNCWDNIWTEGLRDTWEEKVKAMLGAQDPFHGAILALDPIVAREFVDRGFAEKEKLITWIHDNVRIPARRYWDSFTARNHLLKLAWKGEEPYATYAQASPEELIPVLERDMIDIVVVGGETNAMWSAFSGNQLPPYIRLDPEQPKILSVDEWR